MEKDGVLSSFHFNVFSNSLRIRSPYAPPGQRADTICISSFFVNPLISKGLAVFSFQERVVDWLHFERERVHRGKLRDFSWLIIVNTVIDCHYRSKIVNTDIDCQN